MCCIHFEGLVRGIVVYTKRIKLCFKKYPQINNWSYPKQEKKKKKGRINERMGKRNNGYLPGVEIKN